MIQIFFIIFIYKISTSTEYIPMKNQILQAEVHNSYDQYPKFKLHDNQSNKEESTLLGSQCACETSENNSKHFVIGIDTKTEFNEVKSSNSEIKDKLRDSFKNQIYDETTEKKSKSIINNFKDHKTSFLRLFKRYNGFMIISGLFFLALILFASYLNYKAGKKKWGVVALLGIIPLVIVIGAIIKGNRAKK